MATVEERMQILKMVEEGKISAEEGAKLLAALAESRKPPGGGSFSGPFSGGGGEARWFRVRVSDLATGKIKANVNIPVGLVNVGIKMGARFAPGLESEQMEVIAEALKSGAAGKIMDVTDEEDGEHVEIFVE
jgi:hypothetical protein